MPFFKNKKNADQNKKSRLDFFSPFYIFKAAKSGASDSIGAANQAKNDITELTSDIKQELLSKDRVQLHLDLKYVWIRTIGFAIIGILGFVDIITGQRYTGFLMIVVSAFVVYFNVTKYNLLSKKSNSLIIKKK